LLPLILEQARQLIANAPSLLESGRQQLADLQQLSELYNLPIDIPLVEQQILVQLKKPVQAIASGSVGLVLGTFNWVLDLILILVISFYMLIDGERVWRSVISIFAVEIRERLTQSLQNNLQKFVTGQLLLGLFMAISLSFVFWWLKVPFFLLFAVFIGAMEVIPFIGATLGIGTVGLIVVFLNWWLAIQVVAAAIAIQQIKDNVVAPRILGNLTGSSPVIIFVALLLGARVGGLLGVILAIPLIGVFKSIFEIVLDPTLPPQTGSFFFNPVKAGANLLDEAGVGTEDIEDKANQTTPSYSMSNEAES
jgi:predicted PurR-regulated permease PerM